MITRKRKLRTDGSLWQHLRAPCRALNRDTHADVLIVGAGINGANRRSAERGRAEGYHRRPARAGAGLDPREHGAGRLRKLFPDLYTRVGFTWGASFGETRPGSRSSAKFPTGGI